MSKKGLALYKSIFDLSNLYPVKTLCNALEVNISSYKYYLNHSRINSEVRSNIMIKIIEIYRLSNGIYGAPRIANILKKQGIHISLPTVSRYMKILGIKSIVLKTYKRKNNKLSDKEKPLIVNLIKYLKITEITKYGQLI